MPARNANSDTHPRNSWPMSSRTLHLRALARALAPVPRCTVFSEGPLMSRSQGVARLADQPERRHRRFSLCYPVALKAHIGESDCELQALSKNVSCGGLLLQAPAPVPQHCPVSFVMTVQGGVVPGQIHLTGEGKVVRVEPDTSGTGYAIAVHCKHPISQLRRHLPAC